MRCPECSKFVAYDDGTDPEVDSVEVDEDGNVSGNVRIVLTCAECSTELKEATFDIEGSISETFKLAHTGDEDGNHELEVEDNGDFTLESRQESTTQPKGYHVFVGTKDACSAEVTNKKGELAPCNKPADHRVHKLVSIPFRYRRMFYGFSGSVTVKCSCGEEETIDLHDEVQASGMDEV
jgi:hypothetical protein